MWEITVAAGKDPVTGRYRQISRTVRGGKRVAEATAKTLEVGIAGGRHADTEGTVAHLLDRYLRIQDVRGRAPKTLHEYRRIADALQEVNVGLDERPVLLGTIEVRRLTAAHIDELQARLKARGLSDTTRHHYHALLSQALNQAVRWEWIARNPAKGAEAPSLRPVEQVPPSPDEVKALLARIATTHPDLAALIVTAATTGARRGELCGLRHSDIDLAGRQLVIRQAVSDLPYAAGGPRMKDTKTHRVRPMAIDELTAAVLDAQLARARARALACSVELGPHAYVWSQDADHSTWWRPGRVTAAFQTVRRDAGLDHVQLKNLRHFAATQLLAAGEDVRNVAGRLGHDPVMTLRVYGHRIQARDQAAAAILGALLEQDPKLSDASSDAPS